MPSQKSKKAVSPVIATVLLIAMVIVIGLIIFLWFRGLSQEAVTKFGGTNVELVCQDVQFSARYSGNSLLLSNLGNVPIFSIKVEVSGAGSRNTYDISDISNNWPETGVKQGGTFDSGDISSTVFGADKVTVIPVLLGRTNAGEQSHICNDRYGQEIL